MLIGLTVAIGIIILVPCTVVGGSVEEQLELRIGNSNVHIQGGLDAIAEIHKVLDDDQNGAVDSLESEDFIREDLSIQDDEQEDQRQLSLHQGDNSISVLDMQNNWLKSKVRNWTSEDVELWLTDVVGLSQYLPIFRKNGVDGNVLPRLALNTDHLIQTQLGITDQTHKNKIILKAMDLVLFGPPAVFYNPLKDALLALAILVAICGLFFSTVQRKKAQIQVDNMLKEIDNLQINEQKFLQIQTVLHHAEQKNENVIREKQNLEKKLKREIDSAKGEAERLCKERAGTDAEVRRLQLAEEELEQVRLALHNAESKRFDYSNQRELQTRLRVTYRKERDRYNIKKGAAEKQLEEAKQWGLKMKKKKAGMISSLKMLHGNSLEIVENRIFSARAALIEVTNDLQELFGRWRRIEAICNFDITSSNDVDWGSTASLASDSSPEPAQITRAASSPSKCLNSSHGSIPSNTSSLRHKDKKRPKIALHHESSPNLSPFPKEGDAVQLANGTILRNLSSNAIKDLAKCSKADSTDSDDSFKLDKKRKGKNLWRLVRESRKNADPNWTTLMESGKY